MAKAYLRARGLADVDAGTGTRAVVTGPTRDRMQDRGAARILVAFSYSRLYATATATAVKG